MEVYQGDAFNIPISLNMDGTPIVPDMLSELEITFGSLKKRMSKNSILFEAENGDFVFPLSQQETFRLCPGKYFMQARIKLLETEEVFGLQLEPAIIVLPSESKEVI